MVKLNFCMIGCCKQQGLFLDKFFINFKFSWIGEKAFQKRNAFYFISKALFFLPILSFLYRFFSVSLLAGEVDGNLET